MSWDPADPQRVRHVPAVARGLRAEREVGIAVVHLVVAARSDRDRRAELAGARGDRRAAGLRRARGPVRARADDEEALELAARAAQAVPERDRRDLLFALQEDAR